MSYSTFTHERLIVLNQVAKLLSGNEDIRSTLSELLRILSDKCKMNRGVITLMNDITKEIQAAITVEEIPSANIDKMRYQMGEGITGQVFASGESIYIPQLDKEAEFLDRSGLRENLDSAKLAFFCIPILYGNNTIGTISIDMAKDDITDEQSELAFLKEIAQLLAPFIQRRHLEARMELFHRAKEPGGAFAKLIGNSAAIREIQNLIIKVADTRTTVLITGETGVGKGVLSELIHDLGPNKNQPFVEVNCGAIPENLIESELFGHEKGAFTGATQRRIGVLERAKGGTVFLDEIGELPLSAQTRLLRVLQNREFERVGGEKTIRSSARIVTATNRNLEDCILDGSFRSDLYYRLNVFPIHVPPLRERGKADIMLLVNHFIQQLTKDLGKKVSRIDTPAIDMLTSYHWPGNVRELENVIERAVLLADSEVIHGHCLPPSLQMNRYAVKEEDHGDFNLRVKNFEIELITEALKDTNGNQTSAAKRLGITKRIIQYKIRKYDIDYQRFRHSEEY